MKKEVEVEYDDVAVAISIAVAFIGSYLTVTFVEQLRTYDTVHGRWGVIRLLILMALSLGGISIFVMHFIGMHAARLHWHDPEEDARQNCHVKYSSTLTVISLFVVLIFELIGFYVASADPFFRKTPSQIITMFCDGTAQDLGFDKVRHLTVTHMVTLIARKDLGHLSWGGFIAGSGVCLMHYIGMLAMENDIDIRWNWGLVFASVLIAVGASVAAFWILFRLLSLYPRLESLRIAASVVMAVAVCGVHYTGMSAATFVLRDANLRVATTFTDAAMAYRWCIICGLLTIVIFFMAAVTLQRQELRLLRLYIRHLEGLPQIITGGRNSGSLHSYSISSARRDNSTKDDLVKSGKLARVTGPRQTTGILDVFHKKYSKHAQIYTSSEDPASNSKELNSADSSGFKCAFINESEENGIAAAHFTATITTNTTTTGTTAISSTTASSTTAAATITAVCDPLTSHTPEIV